MHPLETAFIELEQLNRTLMEKRSRGERLAPEDTQALKNQVKALHLASSDIPIEDIAALLDRYDLGLGLGHVEPSYERINMAFAWLEARDGDFEEDEV